MPLAFCLVGCSDEYASDEFKDTSSSLVKQKYELSQANLKSSLGQAFQIMEGLPQSRSETYTMRGEDFINYLISLPSEKIDSLYAIYCTPELEALRDSTQMENISILIEVSSPEEVSHMLKFVNNYIESGGHNLNMIENGVQNMTPIIGDYTITSAAIADEFIPDKIDLSRPDDYCLRQLIVYAVGSLVSVEIQSQIEEAAGELIPAMGVVAGLVFIGMDVTDAVKAAHDYDKCKRTHLS